MDDDALDDFIRLLADHWHLMPLAIMQAGVPLAPEFDENDGFDRFLTETLKPVETGE